MSSSASDRDVESALSTFVRGEVRRVRLRLVGPRGEDLTSTFRRIAEDEGYLPRRVAEVEPPEGKRVPAFLIREGTVWFGWIFEERFRSGRSRRIFATSERGEGVQHDWRTILGVGSPDIVLANEAEAETFDPERPDLY